MPAMKPARLGPVASPRHRCRQGGGIFGQSPKKGNAKLASLPMTIDRAVGDDGPRRKPPPSRGRAMLELAAYRLVERPSSPGSFEFVDPETGHVVGVAADPNPTPPADDPGPILSYLLRFRLFAILYALVSL